MASHENIIISMDHTYGAMATVFPDSEVVLSNPNAMPSGIPEALHQVGIEKLGATRPE